jgi:hypothetical protein
MTGDNTGSRIETRAAQQPLFFDALELSSNIVESRPILVNTGKYLEF